MRRADRLIQITHFLRQRRRAVTASVIAENFAICTRTVYRDIQCLIDSGVPIQGEPGIGYVINKDYYLPPITFDVDELEAISLGISMVRQWTDQEFANKAQSAFHKIQAVLPAKLQGEFQQITYAMPNSPAVPWTVSFSAIRECIRSRHKLSLIYTDQNNQQSTRNVRPLALFFFNPVWLLSCWCDLRGDFRNFRVDRIKELNISLQSFEDEEDKNLAAFIKSVSNCHN